MADKRKNAFKPISEDERDICLRFGLARRGARLSQTALAGLLQVSRNQIANIEACRVPLRYYLGDRFCRKLNLSSLWLAQGATPRGPYTEVFGAFDSYLPAGNALFSDVVSGYLADHLYLKKELADAAHLSGSVGGKLEAYENLGCKIIRQSLVSVDPADYAIFLEELRALVRRFQDRFVAPPFPVNLKKDQLSFVDNVSVDDNIENMAYKTMPTFIKLLNRATAQRGMKSQLARFMKVPLSTVSQWLSGEREPSGEATLRLLNWVQQQGRK